MMSDELKFDTYVRTPFRIQALRITEKNIETVAEKVGTVETEESGRKVIILNPDIVQSVGKAYAGWWLTIMDKRYRCYAPRVFERQFMKAPDGAVTSWKFLDDDRVELLLDSSNVDFGPVVEALGGIQGSIDGLFNTMTGVSGPEIYTSIPVEDPNQTDADRVMDSIG